MPDQPEERITLYHAGDSYRFSAPQRPAEPLRAAGSIPISGWDIPYVWAVDAHGETYANLTAHGSTLTPCTADLLLAHAREQEDDSQESAIRTALGLRLAPPLWMRRAKQAGWTPPAAFDVDQYDWADP